MPADPFLTRFLSERDAACPLCGYALRGLTGEVCPECGDRLVLKVGLAEPQLAWFIAGLIGLGGGFGFDAILIGYAGIDTLVDFQGGSLSLYQLMPLLLGFGVLGLLLFAWIRSRRRLGRAPLAIRWSLSLVTFLLSLSFAAWFFIWAG